MRYEKIKSLNLGILCWLFVCMYNDLCVRDLIVLIRCMLLQALCRDVSEHTEKMEAILASMAELASHDTILQPSPVTEHHGNLKCVYL